MTREEHETRDSPTVLRFRPRFSRVWSVVVWLCALVGATWMLWSAQPVKVLPWALVAWLGWWLLWRPEVVVHDDAVHVVNPWATHHIPVTSINDVTSEYHLTLHVGLRKVQAWAAPNDAIGTTRSEYVRNSIHAMRTFTTLPQVERFTGHEGHTHGLRDIVLERRGTVNESHPGPEMRTKWHAAQLMVTTALVVAAVVSVFG